MEQIIAVGLTELGLDGRVPPDAAERLACYGRLLLEKNQTMNLTAIREEAGVARLHILDCAALLNCVELTGGKTLVDVGAGAGFPGMPLKILVPSLEVTLLDSLGKRVDWLSEVIHKLGLTGVRAVHARAEEWAQDHREEFDFAAARAVAGLRLLSELCLPLVKVGGVFIAMKSVDSGEEVSSAGRAAQILGGRFMKSRDYLIPGTGVVHRAVLLEKIAITPPDYPRRWPKIQKKPL